MANNQQQIYDKSVTATLAHAGDVFDIGAQFSEWTSDKATITIDF